MIQSKVAAGLVGCAAVYLSAIYAFVWAGKRRIEWASSRGVALEPEPRFPSALEIWKRHSVDMTVIYATFFLALAIAGFPLWQRVGIAGLTAMVFGSLWIASNSAAMRLDVSSPARRTAKQRRLLVPVCDRLVWLYGHPLFWRGGARRSVFLERSTFGLLVSLPL